MTPQEAWSGYKPKVAHLRVFGCVAYAQVPEAKRRKLDDRGEKCVFVGYSEESKAYKLYNPLTGKIVVSRDVIFSEEEAWKRNNKEVNKGKILSIDFEELEVVPPVEQQPAQTTTTTPLHRTARSGPTSNEESSSSTPLPPNQKAIGVKWVYKIKRTADESVDRYKSRLVAKGYKQKYGVDYDEVYAPVARLDTALYGLKQAPRAWNSKIDNYLHQNGFQKCPYEHSVYMKNGVKGEFLIICLYVDDLLFIGNNEAMFCEFK
ncbi:hypothetical protein ACFX2A_013169 [Malus domestica]